MAAPQLCSPSFHMLGPRLTGLCARPQVGFLAQRVWGGRGLVNNTALPKDVLSSSAEAQR